MAITDNLIAHWALDGGDFTDETGNNNGTNVGTDDAVGKIDGGANSGREFIRTNDDYITIGSNTIDLTDGPITINAWVKADAGGTAGYNMIINSTSSNAWTFVLHNDKIAFGKNGVNEVSGTDTITQGTWAMVPAVYDGSANTVTFYINATADSGGNKAYSSTFTSGLTYRIGSQGNSGYNYDGIMDEVSVWNRLLTSDEITTLHNSGNGLAYPWIPGPDFTKMQINIGD